MGCLCCPKGGDRPRHASHNNNSMPVALDRDHGRVSRAHRGSTGGGSMEVDRQSTGAVGREEPRTATVNVGADLLLIENVSKQFGGTQALADVGMRLNAGEIVAL